MQIRICSEAVCGMSLVHRQVSDCAKSCLLLKQHFLAITLRGVRWWFPEQWHGKTWPKHWNNAWTQALKRMTQLSFRKQYSTYFRWHFLYLQQLHNTEKWKDKMKKNSKVTRTIFQILLNWFLSKFMIPSPSAYASELPISSLPLFPWSKLPRSFKNSFRNLIKKKSISNSSYAISSSVLCFFSPVLFLGFLLWHRGLCFVFCCWKCWLANLLCWCLRIAFLVLASGWSLVLLGLFTGFLLFFQTFLLGWFGYVLATILVVYSVCNFSKFKQRKKMPLFMWRAEARMESCVAEVAL